MPKPKASLKARYATDKLGVVGTLAVDAGDFRLLASATDTTFVGGPSLNGLSLSIEKPGSFFIDYDVPKQVHFSHSDKNIGKLKDYRRGYDSRFVNYPGTVIRVIQKLK